MREILSIIAAMCMSVASFAETIAIESTGHYVPLNDPEYVDLENGYELYPGYRRHISVSSMSGESESHWCYGTNILDAGILAGSELEFGAGYCTILDEDGDVYWTWFEVGKSGTFKWKVMGGTGKFTGSTGEGVTTAVKFHVDGTATFKIEGTIEIVGN